MTKLNFATNVPVRVRLHAIEGKERESQFGPAQHLFSAEEGIFYVSETAGKMITAQLVKLGVQPGDPVEICKSEVDQGRGRKSLQWIVSFPAQDEGRTVEAERRNVSSVPSAKPVAVPRPAAQASPERPRWADVLITNTNTLVDVYAAVLKHASETHGNAVKPESIQSLLVTMFIQYAQKGGMSSAA